MERADARELVTRVLDNLKIGACELLVTVHDSQLLAKQKPTMTATMSTTKKMIMSQRFMTYPNLLRPIWSVFIVCLFYSSHDRMEFK